MTANYREVDHDAFEAIVRAVEAGEFVDTAARANGIKPGRLRAWIAADTALAEKLSDAIESGLEAIVLRTRRTIRGFGEHQGGDSTGDTVRDKAIVDHDMKIAALYNQRWNPKTQIEHGGKVAVTHEEFIKGLREPGA